MHSWDLEIPQEFVQLFQVTDKETKEIGDKMTQNGEMSKAMRIDTFLLGVVKTNVSHSKHLFS